MYILCQGKINFERSVSFPVNANDVLTLAKAGFTAQQIAALSSLTGQPAPAEPQPAQPQPAQPAPPAPASDGGVSAMLEKLGVLTEAIQANGLLNANQPKPQTTDDILAAIIAPPDIKQ